MWKISDGRYLLIEKSAWKKMVEYRQDNHRSYEAGGILLGSRRGIHIHIVDATIPMSSDIRGRYSFDRISPEHRKHAQEMWKKSGQKVTHVGEWHTHPEKHPTPSIIDRIAMRRMARKYRPEEMVSIILGTEGVDVEVFSHRKRTKKLSLLSC